MAQNIAEGSLVLTLDATKLNSGMKKAAADAHKQGDKLKDVFRDNLKEASGPALGKTVEGFAKGGIFGLAIAGALGLAHAILEAATNTEALEKRLEASVKIISDMKERMAETNAGIIETLNETELDKAGVKLFNRNDKRASESVGELQKRLEAAKQKVKDLDSVWKNSDTTMWNWAKGELKAKRKGAEDEAKALEEAVKQQEKAIDQFSKVKRGKEKEVSKEWKKAQFEAAEALAKQGEEADQFIRDLERKVEELKTGIVRTEDQVKLEEMIRAGVDKSKIDRLRKLIDMTTDLTEAQKKANEQYTPLKAIEAGSWDAIGLQNAAKFETEKNNKAAQAKQEKQLDAIQRQLINIVLNTAGLKIAIPEL